MKLIWGCCAVILVACVGVYVYVVHTDSYKEMGIRKKVDALYTECQRKLGLRKDQYDDACSLYAYSGLDPDEKNALNRLTQKEFHR
jgi:hypothetical protein